MLYGSFISISYMIIKHYYPKRENIRDFLFWILHIILFSLYFDSISNNNFRFYDFLFLLLGFIVTYKYIKMDNQFVILDRLVIFLKKKIKIVFKNLFISESVKGILNKIKLKIGKLFKKHKRKSKNS